MLYFKNKIFLPNMKIAIPTDDGEHISDAFGHAHYFLITDEESKETELRHNSEAHEHHESHKHHQGHRHRRAEIIAETLKDVDVIITSHMGKPMIDKMLSEGKIIYVSPKSLKISDALKLYFEGKLRKIIQTLN